MLMIGRHLGSQLAELENAIERMMECDFVSFFMEGLKMKLNKVSGEDEQATEVRIIIFFLFLIQYNLYYPYTCVPAQSQKWSYK